MAVRAERGEAVDLICLDIRKAFDVILHKRLVYKVSKYTVDGEF